MNWWDGGGSGCSSSSGGGFFSFYSLICYGFFPISLKPKGNSEFSRPCWNKIHMIFICNFNCFVKLFETLNLCCIWIYIQ